MLRYLLESRHRRRCLLMALLITAGTALALHPVIRATVPGASLLFDLEMKMIDWRFRQRGAVEPPVDVVIASIDEDTLREFGRWPWPRREMAELVRKISDADARAIVLDIFYAEPDLDDLASDQELVDATREAGNVYHAWFGMDQGRGSAPLQEGQLAALQRRAWPLRVLPHIGDGLMTYGEVTPPLPQLTDAARGTGYADLRGSGDGVFRVYDLAATYDESFYPSLALAVAAGDLGIDPFDIVVTPGASVRLGDQHEFPLIADAGMLMYFYGPSGTIPQVPVRDILNGRIDDGRLGGRIVVLGLTAKGAYELRPSPFGAVFYGVEMQATAIANLLDNRGLRITSLWTDALITGLFGVLIGLILILWHPAFGAVVSVVVFLGYNTVCGLAFTRAPEGIVLPMAAPNVALVACALAILVYRLSTEQRRRDQITQTFGLFVPPQVVSQLTGEDARIERLEAERREITILFTDVRDFTAYSEGTDAEDVVALLNRYFSLMHDVVWEYGGTLDKYMGDGLMAFFGAPTVQEDHAERAVLAAVEMQRQIAQHREEWASYGMGGLRAGMGLHTGEVLVGLTGSKGRMQYTCMGNAVNLASRLEEATRELDADIVISEELQQRIGGLVQTEPVGLLSLRGLSADVMAFSVRTPDIPRPPQPEPADPGDASPEAGKPSDPTGGDSPPEE